MLISVLRSLSLFHRRRRYERSRLTAVRHLQSARSLVLRNAPLVETDFSFSLFFFPLTSHFRILYNNSLDTLLESTRSL